MKGTEDFFGPIEEALANSFLPALFDEPMFGEDDPRRALATLPVKQAGLAIPDPTTTATANYEASTCVCTHLIQALKPDNDVTFSSETHTSTRAAVIAELKKRKEEEQEAQLESILSKLDANTVRTIERGKSCGCWLSASPTAVNGLELSAQEFRDNLHIRHGRQPTNMQPECDGCGAHFTLQHALECKKGGLIHVRHDEVKAELTELCSLALRPSSVRDEPLINPVPLNKDNKSQEPNHTQPTDSQETDSSSNDGDRGNILVRGPHQNGKECIMCRCACHRP